MKITISQRKLPYVSVIVLSWNGKAYLNDLLKSLLKQSYPQDKMEIIVFDNGSTDGTSQFVRKNYPDIKCLISKSNLGFAAGNNQALKHARYDLVAFLNQDTICHQDWLRGLVNGLIQDKRIGLCTSNMILPEVDEFGYRDKNLPIKSLYYYNLSRFGYGKYCQEPNNCFIFPKLASGCAFIIGKKIIAQLGGYLFDEDLKTYVEDTDLSLRVHNLGLKICATRNSVVYHLHKTGLRLTPVSLSLAARAIQNRVYVFFKNMKALEFLIYLPFLFGGGALKITKLRIKPHQKIIYFLPFTFFSTICMCSALIHLPKYRAKRQLILKKRPNQKFLILKLILKTKQAKLISYD